MGDFFGCVGCSKLLENGDAASQGLPMFRTGSGKSVALKQSSIAKALSVLGDEDGDDFPDPGEQSLFPNSRTNFSILAWSLEASNYAKWLVFVKLLSFEAIPWIRPLFQVLLLCDSTVCT